MVSEVRDVLLQRDSWTVDKVAFIMHHYIKEAM